MTKHKNLPIFSLKNSRKVLLILFIFVCNFFTFCSTEKSHFTKKEEKILDAFSFEEKKALEEFFYELLIEEKGIFVLFGSKPMVLTHVSSYKVHDPSASLLTTIDTSVWEKVKERCEVENYVMIKKPTQDPKIHDLIFANRTNIILTLQENHQTFKDILGHDFSPMKEAFDLENFDSPFWNQVFNNHVLTGIILGYGQANAFFFDRWSSGSESTDHKIAGYETAPFDFPKDDEILEKEFSFENIPLPAFRALSTDTTVEKYIQERKRIRQAYQKRDPLIVTLKKLMEES